MNETDQVILSSITNKVQTALKQSGCRTLVDFLEKNPGVPYVRLASDLGAGIAAYDLQILQSNEAVSSRKVRRFAMDVFPRIANLILPDGWRLNAKQDFDTVCVAAIWQARIQGCSKHYEPVATLVWNAILTSMPSIGWSPSGPDDPILIDAFNKGWPESFCPK